MKSEDQDFTTDFVLTPRSSEQPGASDAGVREVCGLCVFSFASFLRFVGFVRCFTSAKIRTVLKAHTNKTQVHAIVLWFDTAFSTARCPETEVLLSTSPFAPTTHWAQTVLPLEQPVVLRCPGE